jgi:hypothetical protein
VVRVRRDRRVYPAVTVVENPRKNVRRVASWRICTCSHSERVHHGWQDDDPALHGAGACHICRCDRLVYASSVDTYKFAYEDDPKHAHEGDGARP